MPLIRIHVVDPPAEDTVQTLLDRATQLVAAEVEKPADYVMACLVPTAGLTLGGRPPACLIEVAQIGISTLGKTKTMSHELCALVHDVLGIPQDRTYVVFLDVERHRWGWDGKTFAG